MARYALGDDTAFVEVYRAIKVPLYSYVLGRLRDRQGAEDVVQQTMLNVHRARGRFVPGSRATPWIFAIATRLLLDRVRRKKVEFLSSDGYDAEDRPSDRPTPEALLACKELAAAVRLALELLSRPQREAYELVHDGRMSHAEAAELLGVSVASVTLRMQRANQTVRDALLVAGLAETSQ